MNVEHKRPQQWSPLSTPQLQRHLGDFNEWVLCGGNSVDEWLGRTTRTHADTDIGVFRSQLENCLSRFDRRQVFLCDPPGHHRQWDGKQVAIGVHDIWISDYEGDNWLLQIMVFDDEGDEVFYRRDPRIRWPKHCHGISVNQVRLLNPLITLLYKANRKTLEAKDAMDIGNLIASLPELIHH
ncbi:MAG: hypothetical protein ACK4TD_00885 [Ectopseudomonas guguanensis]|uniref:hypothetical protein n=1 Tax=Ectopseudomonas guguanensis TaxID=1198456 RepID=UPI00391A50E4